MTYLIIGNESAQKLADEVQEWMDKGFKPQGGITSDNGELLQAMTGTLIQRIISEDFKVVDKGIVPGEHGPEYVFSYQYSGKEGSINLGKGTRNYSDEELKEIVDGANE